ncbi:hypothetical protein ABIC98_000389 [Arthrobacter nitrophenolicus]|uniref:Uncharacterized protein n=1 Tax=Arthrobacter nitrophenolicus TaxID=683150 RepID=A0ACC6TB50_9MICC
MPDLPGALRAVRRARRAADGLVRGKEQGVTTGFRPAVAL